jgi:hypothetical protein
MGARGQLRTAHQMLEQMGMAAFAERARRELVATGETARKTRRPSHPGRRGPYGPDRAGGRGRPPGPGRLSNPEIGARLFISPRTAKYHLSNVFTKLGITSRSQLDRVLPVDADAVGPR